VTAPSILVVEDERIIAKGIEKRLKGLGYTVAGLAASGEEALRQTVDGHPDLVLMDINLGSGIDGVEAAERIRTRADVPVVFLTAFSDDATLQRAKLTEPFGYVLKPYEDKDLQTAIEIGLHKHRAERRVRENERWLAATLGSIGDGVIATDERGRVRFMNPLAEQLTGWTQAGAAGRDVHEVFHIVEERTREPVPNPVLEALARGAPTALAPNTILIARDGTERPIDDSSAPIRGAGGTMSGAVLVFRDVTERRRLEEHLRQAQKMEAIGRLAGGIAHDFNNIMTVITGFSDLLLTGAHSDAECREFAESIHEAGQRAAGLVQQIMAFSRKQRLVPCVLNLNTVVRDMGSMVKRLIGSDIEFLTDPAADLGPVRADPTQLGQVLLNLAANARDAMPRGGHLVVATANAELGPDTSARHPDVAPGRYALLSVTDTGCGMTGEVLAHIFEPFFTTKEAGYGTGLGLATVHGIVKQSAGHIEVDSAVGRGTTVRIYLPRVEPAPPEPAGRELRVPARGRETVLLVEDEEMVRNMTKRILECEGYTVLEATNGLEAVAVAGRHQGPIHLLITDLVMPQLSGRETADRLAGRVARVLYTSGYTEDMVVQQGVEPATAEFLSKPFTITALITKVREVLDRPGKGP
jgi:PAS domain S-box-containing protein